MNINKITENYAVTAQITPEDVATAKAAGYRTIMCNRPDNEEAGQPSSDAIRQAAANHGLAFSYVPMAHGGITMQTMTGFRETLENGEGPILAYCRTGNRCTILWNAVNG